MAKEIPKLSGAVVDFVVNQGHLGKAHAQLQPLWRHSHRERCPKSMSETASLLSLPLECLQKIFLHLDNPESLSLTNRYLREMSKDHLLRAQYFEARYLEPNIEPQLWIQLSKRPGLCHPDFLDFLTNTRGHLPHPRLLFFLNQPRISAGQGSLSFYLHRTQRFRDGMPLGQLSIWLHIFTCAAERGRLTQSWLGMQRVRELQSEEHLSLWTAVPDTEQSGLGHLRHMVWLAMSPTSQLERLVSSRNDWDRRRPWWYSCGPITLHARTQKRG